MNLTKEQRLMYEGIRHDTTMDILRTLLKDGCLLEGFSKSLKLSGEDIEILRKEFEGKEPASSL